jgi:hypothetical protein
LRERTDALLESIAIQKPAGEATVVVLGSRGAAEASRLRWPDFEHVPEDSDRAGQVKRLAAASGCRWLVLPSSVDRYLPGAFEAVVQSGAGSGRTVVGACQVVRGGRPVVVGPEPFRFDYFALLSGLNYIAPGATFIDIATCLANGGLEAGLRTAAVYAYLLRIGAAHGVDCCPTTLLETEAAPFPGVPADWAALYASEALTVVLGYNRGFIPPGTALGLFAVLAEGLAPYRHWGAHDEQILSAVGGAGGVFGPRFLSQLNAQEPGALARVRPWSERLKLRVMAGAPRRVRTVLRRAKRVWKALRDPVY